MAEVLRHYLVHRRLAQAHGLDVAGDGDLLGDHFLQPRLHLLAEDGLHLYGRAGHNDDDPAVPLGPPSGCGAVAVGDELRRGNQPSLLDVVQGHILATVAEVLAQLLYHIVLHRRRLAEGSSHCLSGQVVLRGAQSPGGEYDIGALQPLPEGMGQLSQVVAHQRYPLQRNAQRRQAGCDPAGVGVVELTHKQFGAYAHDLGLHFAPPALVEFQWRPGDKSQGRTTVRPSDISGGGPASCSARPRRMLRGLHPRRFPPAPNQGKSMDPWQGIQYRQAALS